MNKIINIAIMAIVVFSSCAKNDYECCTSTSTSGVVSATYCEDYTMTKREASDFETGGTYTSGTSNYTATCTEK